jgi:hypothetical protein
MDVTPMAEEKIVYRILVRRIKGRKGLGYLGADENIMSKWNLQK